MATNRTPPKKKGRELVAIRLDEVDVERCQIRITQGKGSKDRQVPFPLSFRELLALHMERMRDKGAVYLFESVRKHKYTDRGVRKLLARYATQAGITRSMSPHKWRHFLFTWLKKRALMMPSSNPTQGTPRASRWRSTPGFP